MNGGGSAPAPLNQYALTQGDIQARVDTAPEVFAAEQAYGPQADALSLQSMRNVLQGIPASDKTVSQTSNVAGFRNSETGEFVAGNTAPDWKPNIGQIQRGGNTGMAVNPWQPYTQANTTSIPVHTDATPGYFDLASEAAQVGNGITAASNTAQRQSNINDVSNLGPSALSAIQSSDPAQANEVNALTASTTDDLNAGYNLTPAQMRLAQQAARTGAAARGLGFGPSDNYGEALGVSAWGQNLRQQRIANATGAIGTRQATYGNPWANVLGMSTQPAGQPYLGASNGISSAAMAGMPNFNTSINGGDVANANFNQANARYISGQNNAAATNGAALSAGAGITSAALLAML